MATAFKRLRPLFRERGQINAEVTGRLAETLGGVRIVKAYTAEKREELVFAKGAHRLLRNVAQKVVDGMRSEGEPFKGILFCGIMMTPRGPMVLEFNTRFGDPETEAILLRLETDILSGSERELQDDGRGGVG